MGCHNQCAALNFSQFKVCTSNFCFKMSWWRFYLTLPLFLVEGLEWNSKHFQASFIWTLGPLGDNMSQVSLCSYLLNLFYVLNLSCGWWMSGERMVGSVMWGSPWWPGCWDLSTTFGSRATALGRGVNNFKGWNISYPSSSNYYKKKTRNQ